MHPSEQERFRPIIAARLAALDMELHALDEECRTIAPDVSIGRLSRLDSMQHQQMALAGKRRLEEERGRLREAERRIIQGMYGRCLLCGKDIAEVRLEHQPDAVTCVPCMSKKR